MMSTSNMGSPSSNNSNSQFSQFEGTAASVLFQSDGDDGEDGGGARKSHPDPNASASRMLQKLQEGIHDNNYVFLVCV